MLLNLTIELRAYAVLKPLQVVPVHNRYDCQDVMSNQWPLIHINNSLCFVYHRTGFNCENLIASFSRVRKLLIRKLILLIAHPYVQPRIICYVYMIHYPWCNLHRCNYLIRNVAKRRQMQ